MKLTQLKIIPFIVLLLFLFLFNSCSYFIKSIELTNENWIVFPVNSMTTCQPGSRKNLSFFSNNQSAQKAFEKFLQILSQKKIHLNFIETSVLWSLIQMNARPDQSSPSANFQVLINNQGEQKYWRFLPKTLAKKHVSLPVLFPYFYGLEYLLKEYHAKKGLLQLINLIEENFPFPLQVNEEFEWFLTNFQGTLSGKKPLKKYYFKDDGDEILKKMESLPIPSYTLTYLFYKNTLNKIDVEQFYEIDQTLIEYHPSINCNIDLKKYESSVVTTNSNQPIENVFGLQDKQGHSFLAATFQIFATILPLMDGPFIRGGSPVFRKIPMCFAKKNDSTIELSIVATRAFDPGQLLYHFLKADMPKVQTVNDWDSRVKDARYIFLPNPLKLVFESSRKSPELLEKLLSLDVPIYYDSNLGLISSHINFKKQNEYGFVIDDRYSNFLSCPKDL